MSLPNIVVPTQVVTLPDSGEKVKIRQWQFGDEKAIAYAKETGDGEIIKAAVADMVAKCTFGKVHPLELSILDAEYLFIEIRKFSVGEQVALTIRPANCQKVDAEGKAVDAKGNKLPCDGCRCKVDLNLTEIKRHPDHQDTLKVGQDQKGNDLFVTFWPPRLLDLQPNEGEGQRLDESKFIARCIKAISTEEDSYDLTDVKEEELAAWVDGLSKESMSQVKRYFETIPRLLIKIPYECKTCGATGEHEAEGFFSFFG